MLLEFQKVQSQFAAHIRDPDKVELLDGVEARRMKIYNELFFNNIEGFAAGAFPVLKSLFSEADWLKLVREFLIQHRCSSPYFLEISQEFLSFLQHYDGELTLPGFTVELAHYEWVELALDVADTEPDWDSIDANGDVYESLVVPSPVAWPLCYDYPVHLIGPDYQPDSASGQATYLLVYRSRDYNVQFMEINAVTARLLEIFSGEQPLSGAAAIAVLATEMKLADTGTIQQFGLSLLHKLHASGVILGTVR